MKKLVLMIIIFMGSISLESCEALCDDCHTSRYVKCALTNSGDTDLSFRWHFDAIIESFDVIAKDSVVLYSFDGFTSIGLLIGSPFNVTSVDNFLPYDSVLVYRDTLLVHRFLDSCIIQKGPLCEEGWDLTYSEDTEDVFIQEWLYTIE